MRFEQEGDAFDRSGVGAFTALYEALFNQRTQVGEQADAPAGIALSAKIVGEPLAVRGLREHAGKRELSDPARPGEEHGVRDALSRKHSAKGGHDARVA
jgi:hypothetical protein